MHRLLKIFQNHSALIESTRRRIFIQLEAWDKTLRGDFKEFGRLCIRVNLHCKDNASNENV